MNYSILKKVEKPARYIGGEYGAPQESFRDYNYCMCFPDIYEVGMSNLGIRIVREAIESVDGCYVDYAFAPWQDFGKELKDNNEPLYGLNSKRPLIDFDAIGFSLQYEICYTTVLYMLDLAHIPLLSKDRDNSYPIIEGGGPCCANPEPIADFFDLFIIGDGEDINVQLAKLHKEVKNKEEFLLKASELEGVYVPKYTQVIYDDNGRIKEFKGITKIHKTVCYDLDKAPFPHTQPVGNIEAVFDRAVIEVMRGCPRGCRFCQAGFLYRPIRYKSVDTLVSEAVDLVKSTGFDELSLNSLSTGDYPCLLPLLEKLKSALPTTQIALPSLRIDSFKGDFVENTKKNSLTFAPEAGSQRLRDVINKDINDDEIERSITQAFKQGYQGVKLYFMMGLPTETDEDLYGISDIVQKIRAIYKEHKQYNRELRINVSVSTFIPKPFTPFMWERQIDNEEFTHKVALLKEKLFIRGVTFNWNDFQLSQIEAVLARGDRRLSSVILSAYKNGAYLEGWSEFFNGDIWFNALKDNNLTVEEYTRARDLDEILPWDLFDINVEKSFFKNEREKAYKGNVTGPCFNGCKACGVQKKFKCKLC